MDNKQALAELMSAEQGKPVAEAQLAKLSTAPALWIGSPVKQSVLMVTFYRLPITANGCL